MNVHVVICLCGIFIFFVILLSTNSKFAGYGCRRLLDTDVDDSTRMYTDFVAGKLTVLTLKNLTFYVIQFVVMF